MNRRIPLDLLPTSLETSRPGGKAHLSKMKFVNFHSVCRYFLRPASIQSILRIHLMRPPAPIAARLVIWLIAITMPVQGLPAADCGCSGVCIETESKTDRPTDGCALAKREAGDCCCSKQHPVAKPTCCRENLDSQCQCGEDCRCGTDDLPQPSVPVSQESATEKTAQAANPANGEFLLPAPRTTGGRFKATLKVNASTALDRCVLLCRFTL